MQCILLTLKNSKNFLFFWHLEKTRAQVEKNKTILKTIIITLNQPQFDSTSQK